jgi:hypothetical protein
MNIMQTVRCISGRHELVFCEGFPVLAEDCIRCKHCPYVSPRALSAPAAHHHVAAGTQS